MGSGEKTQGYFSYTNTVGRGIIDNNRFIRHNFNLRYTGNLTNKLSFDSRVTFQPTRVENPIKTDENFANVNRQITRLPPNISIDDAKQRYQYYNVNGQLRQNYWNPVPTVAKILIGYNIITWPTRKPMHFLCLAH